MLPAINTTKTDQEISIVLVINKESMLLDPIEWSVVKRDLREWAKGNNLILEIPAVANKRFLERTPLSHLPRKGHEPTEVMSVYHFFVPEKRSREENVTEMLRMGIPLELAKLLEKINNHSSWLSTLGILPNQLRSLLKTTTDQYDEAFQDISNTLFWQGYQIWKERRKLVSEYWKNVAPKDWQPEFKKNKKAKSKRKRTITMQLEAKKCTEPFHFMNLHSDYSQQKPTPCVCSRVQTKPQIHRFHDIGTFFRGLETQSTSLRAPIPNITKPNNYLTRQDKIRGEHDRKKKQVLK